MVGTLKGVSPAQFDELQTENTDNGAILLIFKSMLMDVVSTSKNIVTLQSWEHWREFGENNPNLLPKSQFFEDYKYVMQNIKAKWNDMSPESVNENHESIMVAPYRPIIDKFKNKLTELDKNSNGEFTGDFKIKLSMYSYYLLNVSEEIFNSFINDNHITDKRLLLEMRLWLITIGKHAYSMSNYVTMASSLIILRFSDKQKKEYDNMINSVQFISDFIKF